MTGKVQVEIKAPVATITLNKPERLNALDVEVWEGIREAAIAVDAAPGVRAVILQGAGGAFCAGLDVKAGSTLGAVYEASPGAAIPQIRAHLGHLQECFTRLERVRVPVIAAIQRVCMGAGMELALCCDIRIAAESAIMSTGYARIGLTGDYGIAWLLTRLVGTSRARELMFTADKVDAARCEAIGLVNRVVPDAKLQEEAFALAKSMAEGPTIALRYMKDNLDEALLFDFATARDHEAARLIRTTITGDHREAVQAFIEKRKAVFNGS